MTTFRLMSLTTVMSAAAAGFAGDARADHRYPSCNSYSRTTYVETVPTRTVVYTEPVRYYQQAPCVRTYPVYERCGQPDYRDHRPRYVEVRTVPVPRYPVVRYAPLHHHRRPAVSVRFDGRSHHRSHRRGYSLHLRR